MICLAWAKSAAWLGGAKSSGTDKMPKVSATRQEPGRMTNKSAVFSLSLVTVVVFTESGDPHTSNWQTSSLPFELPSLC